MKRLKSYIKEKLNSRREFGTFRSPVALSRLKELIIEATPRELREGDNKTIYDAALGKVRQSDQG